MPKIMKEHENRNYDLEVTAGHCSLNRDRLDEAYEMADIQVSDGQGGFQRALTFVRWVGEKSRTEYGTEVEQIGLDAPIFEQVLVHGSSSDVLPTVLMAEKFVRQTGIGIASEIMIPSLQMPQYEGRIPEGKFLPWNPASQQLGWLILQMALSAHKNGWPIGLKNGKWLGEPYEKAINTGNNLITSMEKAWAGLATFAQRANVHYSFIHRGVDIPEKGDFRNALTHEVVKRLACRFPQAGRYFDPSHSLGPKLRDHIVAETIEAMRMKIGNEFLYTGILIEVGTSKTDTHQHISIEELRFLLSEIATFRKLRGPHF